MLNLNVYDFFNIQAKATKLCDFSYKIYLETIWYKLSLVIKSNDAMAPTSDIQISANFEFCFANFTFKIIWEYFLLFLITFWPILTVFEGFRKKQNIQDGGFKMAAILENYDVIP